jgi:hypothetical protein
MTNKKARQFGGLLSFISLIPSAFPRCEKPNLRDPLTITIDTVLLEDHPIAFQCREVLTCLLDVTVKQIAINDLAQVRD